ncbi:MAG: hypothetical protein HY034_05570 [Nitrospirae bacterium]|nr:hypothetical protein [Nitrospirota bacterium]
MNQADTALRLYNYFLSKKLKTSIPTNFQTTMIYTHVAKKNILGVRNPLDE